MDTYENDNHETPIRFDWVVPVIAAGVLAVGGYCAVHLQATDEQRSPASFTQQNNR